MRVAHICKSFSPLSQTFIYDYVTELERQGIDNHVLTLKRLNEEDRSFKGVSVMQTPHRWHPLRVAARLQELAGFRETGTSLWPLYKRRLEEALRNLNPDVVHAHFGPMGVLIQPIAGRLGLPLVVSFYGHDISRLTRMPSWRKAYKKLWSDAKAVVVLSEEMKQSAVELACDPRLLDVVHLSRNIDLFPYSPPENDIRNLLSVGRLTDKKGHFDALKAVRRVIDEGHNVSFRIIGGGHLEEEIRACVSRHDLQKHVQIDGARPNAEVAEALREADAFLLCSKTAEDGDKEGTPTVLIEAQATGLPCVTTHHAGIPEMIPEENHGLLSEEGNAEQTADRILQLIGFAPRELRKIADRGRKKVDVDFNLSREVEKLTKIYEQAQDGQART